MHTEEIMLAFDREMRALDDRVYKVGFEAESREAHHINFKGEHIGAFRVSVTCYDPPESFDNMSWQDGVGVSLEDAISSCRAKMIAWQEERNGNSNIYGYDLSARTEFPICTELHEQANPLVSGTRVVWLDKRHSWWEEELNYWFYGYDLATGTELPIARYDAIFSMGLQDFDGDTIVYYDMSGEGSWKIMGLRLP